MPFIPIPNSASLCFDFVTAGQNWQFCLTVRKSSGSITPTDLATLTGIGEAWWLATLDSIIGNNTTLKQVRATDQQTEGGPVDIEITGTAGAGGGDLNSLGAPLCISLRTAKRGRSYRGRAYVSGIPGTELASEVEYGSTPVASFVSAFSTLQGSLDTAGFDLVVASKQHNGATTNPAETNEVIAIVADTKVDSMRKRLSGRGT
jgi:hypothetical protein